MHTRKLPTVRGGDQRSPSAVRKIFSEYFKLGKGNGTCPLLNAAFLNGEDEYSARLYYGIAFPVAEPTCSAGDDASNGSMDEAAGVNGGLNEDRVWATRHRWETLSLLHN
jgi:hypothetical protein